MSLAISSALFTAPAAANSPSTSAAPQPAQQPVQQLQPSESTPAYKVTLTEAQQVFNLYNQGQTVTQIATSLSLSENLVNNYLGITAGGG